MTAWENLFAPKARPGYMRLLPPNASDLASARNTLTQCMQDNSFEFTVRIDLSGMKNGVHAGLAMFERMAGGLEVVQSGGERNIYFFHAQERTPGPVFSQGIVQLRVRLKEMRQATFTALTMGVHLSDLGMRRRFSSAGGRDPGRRSLLTQRKRAIRERSILIGSTMSRSA